MDIRCENYYFFDLMQQEFKAPVDTPSTWMEMKEKLISIVFSLRRD